MYTLRQRGAAGNSTQWERPEAMPQILHALLYGRGIASAQEAEIFLHPQAQPLHDPMMFPGAAQAAAGSIGLVDRSR